MAVRASAPPAEACDDGPPRELGILARGSRDLLSSKLRGIYASHEHTHNSHLHAISLALEPGAATT